MPSTWQTHGARRTPRRSKRCGILICDPRGHLVLLALAAIPHGRLALYRRFGVLGRPAALAAATCPCADIWPCAVASVRRTGPHGHVALYRRLGWLGGFGAARLCADIWLCAVGSVGPAASTASGAAPHGPSAGSPRLPRRLRPVAPRASSRRAARRVRSATACPHGHWRGPNIRGQGPCTHDSSIHAFSSPAMQTRAHMEISPGMGGPPRW